MTYLWITATVAAMVAAHFWVPAYALAVIFALLALAAHETRHSRAAEKRRRRRGGFLHG